jgi:hypothetical protein
MKKRRIHFIYFILLLLGNTLVQGCFQAKVAAVDNNIKPTWVEQRPTNTMYYVGIGYANKLDNSGDYQRVAKKNALDDMMGEIKVTVSSNSILSQYQNNQNFNQQFFSDTRMVASETMEGFQVMDSWENKSEYWIYYRMSKAEFEAYRKRKIREASEKALDYMNRADLLDPKTDYIQIFKLRVSAAAAVQKYLNEPIETEYKGKTVFLMNELVAQMQDQLLLIRLKVAEEQIQITSGKSMEYPILANAFVKGKDSVALALAYLPLKLSSNGIQFRGNPVTETLLDGSGTFAIGSIQSKDPLQIIQVKPDIDRLLRSDSLNASMRQLLLNLESPSANIKVKIVPIKIILVSQEMNMDQKLSYPILEPAIKKKLLEKGCQFVTQKEQADYILEINALTKDQGIMWGNMLRANIDMNLVLKDAKTGNELFHDAIEGLQGFQTTKEKAGVEAYRAMSTEMLKRCYPQIEELLYPGF